LRRPSATMMSAGRRPPHDASPLASCKANLPLSGSQRRWPCHLRRQGRWRSEWGERTAGGETVLDSPHATHRDRRAVEFAAILTGIHAKALKELRCWGVRRDRVASKWAARVHPLHATGENSEPIGRSHDPRIQCDGEIPQMVRMSANRAARQLCAPCWRHLQPAPLAYGVEGMHQGSPPRRRRCVSAAVVALILIGALPAAGRRVSGRAYAICTMMFTGPAASAMAG